MADNKVSKQNKHTLSEAEVEVFKIETKTHPESFLKVIERDTQVTPSGRKDRKNLSKNNFAHDLEGNFDCGDKFLKMKVYEDLLSRSTVLVRDIDDKFFWLADTCYVSDESLGSFIKRMPKKFQDFVGNKKEENDITFVAHKLRESNIWIQSPVEELKTEEPLKQEIVEEETDIQVLLESVDEITQVVSVAPEVTIQEQLKKMQETLDKVLQQNLDLQMQMREKDLTIQRLTESIISLQPKLSDDGFTAVRSEKKNKQIEEKLITPKVIVPEVILVKEEIAVSEKSLTGTIPKVVKPKKMKIKKFVDDGIKANLVVVDTTTEKQALETLDIKINFTPEQLSKVVNSEVREVNSEPVVEPFSDRLKQDLEPTEQTVSVAAPKPVVTKRSNTLITFTPIQRASAKKDPTCPKGILPTKWNIIKGEMDLAKRDFLIRREYLSHFRTDFFTLQNRWKNLLGKARNPYLISSRNVWVKLSSNKTENLHKAMLAWKTGACAITPSHMKLTEAQTNWYKNQSKVTQS